MSALFWRTCLLAGLQAPSQRVEIDAFNSGEYTRIIFTNEGDQDVDVWRALSDNSISGNISLEFFENGVPKRKKSEGYSVYRKKEVIKLSPGYSYGISIPTNYLRNAYGLGRGCYGLMVKVASPPNGTIVNEYISSKILNICFKI